MGVSRSQGVGVGKNWVLGISVGTNRGGLAPPATPGLRFDYKAVTSKLSKK